MIFEQGPEGSKRASCMASECGQQPLRWPPVTSTSLFMPCVPFPGVWLTDSFLKNRRWQTKKYHFRDYTAIRPWLPAWTPSLACLSWGKEAVMLWESPVEEPMWQGTARLANNHSGGLGNGSQLQLSLQMENSSCSQLDCNLPGDPS